MTGRRWTTDDQLAFLESHFPKYQQAQADKTLSSFWPFIYRTWFERYPERESMFPGSTTLTTVQEEELKSRLTARQHVSCSYCINDASRSPT